MRPLILPLAALLLNLPAAADSRPWRSAEGSRSFLGEFVKRDAKSVTVMRQNQREAVIPLDQLHETDRKWIDANHPMPATKLPPDSAVFDQLAFGDTRTQVLEKLKASKYVELTVAETFVGRTGLNGVFKTRSTVGGLDASLYFDWDERGGLKEVTLQTEALPGTDIKSRLLPCWKEFIPLLASLHGKPLSANEKPDFPAIASGQMAATHLWKLDPVGSALLGAAREDDKFQIVVRFTRDTIKPVPIP